jgi:arylsulfatase A-like enzyme
MKRPNILILYTDQQRWDAVGTNGNPEIKTPNLDRLAKEGLNYDHFFVQNPVCMPSRVSFLSGQYPSQLRITHMAVPVPEGLVTLPHLVRNYGYATANIGKLHFLPHANRDHREIHPPYGFDHLEISDEPGCYEDAYRAWVRRKAPDQLDKISVGLPPATVTWQKMMGIQDGIKHPELREPRTSAFPARADLTHTAFVAEQTTEYIRKHAGGPFMCIAGFYSPHSPWVAPQEFLDMYEVSKLSVPRFPAAIDAKRDARFSDEALRLAKQGYYAMISEVDHYVGNILACLDQVGIADDTIVIFTSDHGEYLGEFLRYGKGFPGEDCISRVPMIARWRNGVAQAGLTVSHIVEAVDVVPTLLQWAGIPIPGHLQGAPLPTSNEPSARTKGSALLEFSQGKNLRTERYRYVVRLNGQEALYDLAKDLGEYFDVAKDPAYAGVLSEMRGELVRRMLQMERPLPRTWPY